MNDDELNSLLREWEAPPAPASLEARVMAHTATPWWRWLLTGSIRIPVPVLLALLVMAAAIVLWRRPAENRRMTIAGFEPARQLQPKIIRSAYENR